MHRSLLRQDRLDLQVVFISQNPSPSHARFVFVKMHWYSSDYKNSSNHKSKVRWFSRENGTMTGYHQEKDIYLLTITSNGNKSQSL